MDADELMQRLRKYWGEQVERDGNVVTIRQPEDSLLDGSRARVYLDEMEYETHPGGWCPDDTLEVLCELDRRGDLKEGDDDT